MLPQVLLLVDSKAVAYPRMGRIHWSLSAVVVI